MHAPSTEAVSVLYTLHGGDSAVAIFVSAPGDNLKESAVLFDNTEPIPMRLERDENHNHISTTIGRLALSPKEVPSFTCEASAQVVSVGETHQVLYEHLGATGRLLTPLAAIQLAGAVKLARSRIDEGAVFSASWDNVRISPHLAQLFMARGRRRQSERLYGQSITPWPTGYKG